MMNALGRSSKVVCRAFLSWFVADEDLDDSIHATDLRHNVFGLAASLMKLVSQAQRTSLMVARARAHVLASSYIYQPFYASCAYTLVRRAHMLTSSYVNQPFVPHVLTCSYVNQPFCASRAYMLVHRAHLLTSSYINQPFFASHAYMLIHGAQVLISSYKELHAYILIRKSAILCLGDTNFLPLRQAPLHACL
eukprot:1157697-Pelagomonas_calceolata.AAC.5